MKSLLKGKFSSVFKLVQVALQRVVQLLHYAVPDVQTHPLRHHLDLLSIHLIRIQMMLQVFILQVVLLHQHIPQVTLLQLFILMHLYLNDYQHHQ
jgi:hypothetical protein